MLFDNNLSVSLGKGNKRKKINKCNYTKLKSFYMVKTTISKIKTPPAEWEKIFAGDISDKRLMSKIQEDLQLNIKYIHMILFRNG